MTRPRACSPRVAAALVALWLASSAATAAAQPVSREDEARARALFLAGQAAVDEGHYASAIVYFERSYALCHRGALLFNLASAAEHLRRDALALASYRAYLRALPHAENRTIVEARIRLLEHAIAGEPIEPAPDDVPDVDAVLARVGPLPPPDEDESSSEARTRTRRALGIGGGAIAAVGGVLGALGMRDRATVENADVGTTWAEVDDAHARAPRRMAIGAGLAGLGLSCAITALLLDRGDEEPPPAGIGMDVASNHAEVTAWWSF